MIDSDGFRPNVGLIIFNDEGKLLWAKRFGQDAWQFPQGGIQRHEKPENAALRERVAALEQGAAPIAPVSGTAQLALVLVAGLLAGAAIGAGAFALGRSRQK